MTEVEFNNCFFPRIDRGVLCWAYPRLGLPGPLGAVLVWLCWDTAGLCPGTTRALVLVSSAVLDMAPSLAEALWVSGTGTSEGDVGDGADS